MFGNVDPFISWCSVLIVFCIDLYSCKVLSVVSFFVTCIHIANKPLVSGVLIFFFQKCPEIVPKFEIVMKFYSFGKNVLKLAFDAQ